MTDRDGLSMCTGEGCGRMVRWVITEGARRLALDPEPHADGNVVEVTLPDGRIRAKVLGGAELPAQQTAYLAHWVTCPAAETFRRRQRITTPKCRICSGRLHQLAVDAGWTRHPLCGPPMNFRELTGLEATS